MSDSTRDEGSLSSELSALRCALRKVRAPDDEPALRSAARLRAAARAGSRAPSPARMPILTAARARVTRARRPLALAAAAAIAGVAALGVLRFERSGRVQHAERADEIGPLASSRGTDAMAATPAAAPDVRARSAFRPISWSRRLSPAESYSVVRVRLELASNAAGAATSAAIEADLLVGEDGLARAIRFDTADTLPVYAGAKLANGERR